MTERSSLEVNVDGAGKSVGNDKRRGGKIVGSSVRMDTSLEVSVTRENSRCDKVVIDDAVLDLVGDLTRVTDASHATISSGGETELVKVLLDTSLFVVLSDNVGAGGEGGLDVGFDGEALLDSVLGEKTSLEHNIGVGCVSARGDGSNDKVTLVESVLLSLVSELGGFGSLSLFKTETLEAYGASHALVEIGLHVSEVDAIMRSLRSRKGALNSGKIELHNLTRVGWVGLRSVMLDEEILLAQVLLNKLDVAFITASGSQVLHSAAINWEVAHSGTILGSHVGNSSSIGKGEVLAAWAEELNEFANNTALSEHLDASQDEISSGGTLRKGSVEVETDNLGQDHGDGLSKHDSLSLNTANTPAGNAETVDHSGVRVGTDDRVWVEHVLAVEDNTCKVLKIDLMDNTRARGDDLEVVESL